jgi:DNA-binding MarR family transcriptional regulator
MVSMLVASNYPRRVETMPDSVEACASELITFVKGMKRLALAPVAPGERTLERPALLCMFALAEHSEIRPSALAEHLFIDLSTASRQLAALEAEGLVARERDPDDRRAFLVHMTDEGKRVLHANMAARRALLGELLTDWSEDDRRDFARLLGQLNVNLQKHHTIGACKESP